MKNEKKILKVPKIDLEKQINTAKFNLAFILIVVIIQLCSVAIVVAIALILSEAGVIALSSNIENNPAIIVLTGISSIIIGIGLGAIAAKFFMKPFKQLVEAMMRLSQGDYSTRIDFGNNNILKEAEQGFNNLATELGQVELLRADFVNNFSHEFKTPIASISGLLELLKRDDLTTEKRQEYIAVIEEETHRLHEMSTNVLNLSKIENETSLKNITRFNLSEQIRSCIVLLEKKWSKKDLSLSLDFDEFMIRGDEEMLKQVWINLLDNAIKFAEEKSELVVEIEKPEKQIIVKITNTGVEIKDEEREKIFNKFYQSDSSHSKEGNGIGLSIVKHIVVLHGGTIEARSRGGKTTFTIKI
ncbi:MAG: HAMP domain-containing histidine kinase [Clostridia bacterium]|nr:HAMP domain-containing histidine kinase [Clostridia bacterium]